MAKKNGNNKRQNHHHPNKKRGRRERGGGGGKTPRKENEEGKTKERREDTELTLAVVNRCVFDKYPEFWNFLISIVFQGLGRDEKTDEARIQPK